MGITEAVIPSPIGDTNKLNLYQMINLVAYKIFKKSVTNITFDEKQLITNELNEAQRELAAETDQWKWLNKTAQINGYNYEPQITNAMNPNVPIPDIDTPNYPIANAVFAEPLSATTLYAISLGQLTNLYKFTSISLALEGVVSQSSNITMQVIICPDVNGQPNYLNQLTQTSVTAYTLAPTEDRTVTLPFTGQIYEPVTGTKYWAIITINSVSNVHLKGYLDPTGNMLQSTDSGSTWTQLYPVYPNKLMTWFTIDLTPRNYPFILVGPSDCAIPQRLYTPQGSNFTSIYNLREMPWDYVQQSFFTNYMLGVTYFAVMGYTDEGQPKIQIPMNLKLPLWQLDYVAKVTTMVDDDDYPQVPSEYRTLLVLMATNSLIALGYGQQDAMYIALIQAPMKTLRLGLIRAYCNTRGEQFVQMANRIHYRRRGNGRGGAGLNNANHGIEQIGISLPTGGK